MIQVFISLKKCFSYCELVNILVSPSLLGIIIKCRPLLDLMCYISNEKKRIIAHILYFKCRYYYLECLGGHLLLL